MVGIGKISGKSAPLSLRQNPNFYELHALVWLSGLSRRFGRRITLGNVPDTVWDELAAQGWNLLWLMGVWERSPASAAFFLADDNAMRAFDAALPGWKPEQVVGSPYSIRNYQPDARIGAWDDLDRARAALHRRGIGLILDFVANHTALDNPWTCEHPEYYIRGTVDDIQHDPQSYFAAPCPGSERIILAHGRDPYFPAWQDVAQLNLFSEITRAALVLELRTIAQHCDGLRCDMAMLVLNGVFPRTWGAKLGGAQAPKEEFWTEAINAVPGLLWLGEAYWGLEGKLLQMGFQFTYDKTFYDLLLGNRAAEFASYVRSTAALASHMAHFLENHDEERSAVAFGPARLPAAATLLATMPGMRFYYQGQLEGSSTKLPIYLNEIAPQKTDPVIQQLYETLLRVGREETLHSGDWRVLNVTSAGDGGFANLCAYQWRKPEDFWAVIANPSEFESQGRVHFPEGIAARQQYVFGDELNDVRYLRDGTEIVIEGLYVRLAPHQAHIFRIQPA